MLLNVEALYPCHVPAKVEAAFEKTFVPVKVLLSVRRVEEADIPALPVIVIGDEPMTVKGVHEAVPEHETVVVAMFKRE